MSKLSDTEFRALSNKIDAGLRATKRGTPERAAAQALADRLDALLRAPDARFVDREAKFAAIAAFAAEVSS